MPKIDKRTGRRQKGARSAVQNPYSLDELFERFYRAKVAEGRTKRTLESYRENYGYLIEYMDECGLGRDVRNITVDFIRDYITYMLEEKVQFEGHRYKPKSEEKVGLSPATVNHRLKTWRAFFRFLTEEGVITENPFKHIKKVEENEYGIEILTVDELRALLNAPDQRRYAGFRDYVLMTFLLDTFTRITEALSLREGDIDIDSCTVKISADTSKSRADRYIPIEKRTLKLLLELIRENDDFDTDYVFLLNYGEQLTPGQFRHRLKEHAKKAGIKKRVHPHVFRHTGATMFLESGGDLRHLQKLLGHKDLRMVLRYTHISKRSLSEQHRKHTPLNIIYGNLSKERKVLR